MPVIERSIRAILENVPSLMFVGALTVATFMSDIPVIAERYLAWLLLLTVGVQGIWGGITHVFFPEVGARYIGWQTSPFQIELGIADLAMGCIGILSFWSGLEFKAAVVAYVSIFYLGVGIAHIREMKRTGNREKGNFGALLAMTFVKAFAFPILLWMAHNDYSSL